MERICELTRKTLETEIKIKLEISDSVDVTREDGIDTGIPFFDHMLAQLAKHGGLSLRIQATGDLQVDYHHTVEDVGIVLGQSLKQILGDYRGIQRFGNALVPMDDALSRVVVDLSGRSYLFADMPFSTDLVGQFPTELVEEFLRALAFNAGMTLHVELLHGRNTHHQVEAIFKALGQSLKLALALTGLDTVPSTKGVLS